MTDRRERKRRAREVLRAHALLLMAACLIAAVLGAEFSGSLGFITPERGVQGPGGAQQVLERVLAGDMQGARERAQEAMAAYRTEGGGALGRSNGVIAAAINQIASGNAVVWVASALMQMGLSRSVAGAVMILLALGVVLTMWFYVINLFAAASARVFLESRVYERVGAQRFLVFPLVRRWTRAAATMLLTTVRHALWSLTVVGGFIKHYSYFAVPYIVAENPGMDSREAVLLSRWMMNGHKWSCFLLDVSFLPLDLLNFLTLGLAGVLYVNPYRKAAHAEFYAQVRREALEGGLPGTQALEDRYLFEKADAAALRGAYPEAEEPAKEPPTPEGPQGVLTGLLGITLVNRADERRYEQVCEVRHRAAALREAALGRAYPGQLSPVPQAQKRERLTHIHYMRRYSVTSLLLLFFIASFVGWLWEGSLCLVTEGRLVNRGVLHGPWLPIYGSGTLVMLVALFRLRERPARTFVAAVLLSGLIEYGTAFFLETAHGGQKWWDYAGYFLNLDGRICCEGLLIFGVGGMAFIYLLAPLLDDALRRIGLRVAVPLCVALLLAFAGDQLYSSAHPNAGEGITSAPVAQKVMTEGGSTP